MTITHLHRRSVNPLQSLVYSSRASASFDELQLPALLEHSRSCNAAVNVTGMLLYRQGRFIQFLEGNERDVRALFAKIRDDSRHQQMRVLLDEPIQERQFAEWTMGFEPSSIPSEPAPIGFRDTFQDLDEAPDHLVTSRAARELTLWFRVRAAHPRWTAA